MDEPGHLWLGIHRSIATDDSPCTLSTLAARSGLPVPFGRGVSPAMSPHQTRPGRS